MRIAIMQPSFLPWAGYFYLIDKSDQFVFLNDSQFQKNSWHNRNRILVNGQPHWITIPIKKGKLSKTLKETTIDSNQNWKRKITQTVIQSYAKCAYPEDLAAIIALFEEAPEVSLGEMNIFLIKSICRLADIRGSFANSDTIPTSAKRTDRLIEIIEHLDASIYLSPVGSQNYLEADDFSGCTNIALEYSRFIDHSYHQIRTDIYQEKLSVVDIVANIGFIGFKEYIRNET